MEYSYQKLREAGEYYAAELIVNQDREPIYRYSKAYAEYVRHAVLTPYDGGKLYPCGRSLYTNAENSNCLVRPNFSYTYEYNNWNSDAGKALRQQLPDAAALLEKDFHLIPPWETPHTVGGAGYTHSFINFSRILADGLNGYRARVERLPEGDFKAAMLILLDGIEVYRQRCLAHLREVQADVALIAALEHVPNHSPRNIYEALVAWNFVYYVDGCDDIGGLDRGLYPYWKGEDIRPLIAELFRHIDANDGWSLPLGPHHNELTVQCIDACHGIRRPNIQLLVTDDMPEEVWEAACRSLATSCGQPAFYNWNGYKKELNNRLPQVSTEDEEYIAFGGCTETMIEGRSNVGSDDAGVNTALIFSSFMRENLGKIDTFEQFFEEYARLAEQTVAETCGHVERYRIARAKYRPQPIRTLFVDDCIDKMMDFNAGGARYYWSVVNVAGLINVIDSMSVIKNLVYEQKLFTAEAFLEKLDSRDPRFLALCAAQPKHGNDEPSVNEIANKLSERIYSEFERHSCTPAGRYFPVSNQFTTYEFAGYGIPATPDGRGESEPLCDSCGAIRGRDKKGPTALLASAASLRLDLVLGTPITNIRISKKNLPVLLKPLVEGFFDLNGMQLQVTCASREELVDAVAHPEKYGSLIVRVGGYSEYFTRLSPVLQQTVIDRVEY